MIRRAVTIFGIAVVALSILAACSVSDDSSSSSSSTSALAHYFTKGEVEEDFINWLCPGSPRIGKLRLSSGPNPIAGLGWSVTIGGSPSYGFEMHESTGIWVGTSQDSTMYGASIRSSDSCR
jgi:hypothetical protein